MIQICKKVALFFQIMYVLCLLHIYWTLYIFNPVKFLYFVNLTVPNIHIIYIEQLGPYHCFNRKKCLLNFNNGIQEKNIKRIFVQQKSWKLTFKIGFWIKTVYFLIEKQALMGLIKVIGKLPLTLSLLSL